LIELQHVLVTGSLATDGRAVVAYRDPDLDVIGAFLCPEILRHQFFRAMHMPGGDLLRQDARAQTAREPDVARHQVAETPI
jgi:hypothetical protein